MYVQKEESEQVNSKLTELINPCCRESLLLRWKSLTLACPRTLLLLGLTGWSYSITVNVCSTGGSDQANRKLTASVSLS